jgi:hypothetical protein
MHLRLLSCTESYMAHRLAIENRVIERVEGLLLLISCAMKQCLLPKEGLPLYVAFQFLLFGSGIASWDPDFRIHNVQWCQRH